MLILSKDAIEQSFSMKDAIEASKIALMTYSKSQATTPLRTNIDIPVYSGQGLYMPASTLGDVPALGVKIVSVYPNNVSKGLPSVPATMVVQDPKTGMVSALLDGTYLTQLRTAAVQGVATELLAKPDAEIATLIGTGGQGFQQAIAMMTVRQLTELRVFDIDFERAKTFASELALYCQGLFDTKITATREVKDALFDADIVTTVTTSKVPTFDVTDIKAGVHVNGMGSYTPDMIELPPELITKADLIVFDTKDGVLAEAGDILKPLENGLISYDVCNLELGELLLKKQAVQRDSNHLTVFKSVGSAVLDVVTAQMIVEKATGLGLGQIIDY